MSYPTNEQLIAPCYENKTRSKVLWMGWPRHHEISLINQLQLLISWNRILSLLIVSALIFDIIFFRSLNNSAGKLGQYFFTILLAGFILIMLYLFPVIAAFNATLIQDFRNAFFFALSRPLATLTLFISTVIPVSLTYFAGTYFGAWLFCWVFFGIGLLGRFQSRIFIELFRKYLE